MNVRVLGEQRHAGMAVWLMIMVLAITVRFYGITLPYVWYDEAFSVWISALSPGEIWFHTGRDVHPPLYYLLLHGWMELFGKTPFSIRAPSAIAGVLTVAVCITLARKTLGYRAAIITGFLMALFPVSVRFSQEARMYALVGLFLVGATLALVCWLKHSERHRYGVLYAVLMAAALYTHYYAVLAVLAHWLYLVVLRLHPAIRSGQVTGLPWWIFNLLIFVIYIPWLLSLVDLLINYSKLQEAGNISWLSRGWLYTLPDVVWRFFTLITPRETSKVACWLMLVFVVMAGARLVFLDKSVYRFSLLLVMYSFVPMLVLFGVSLVAPVYSDRYLVVYAIGLPLICAGWLVQLGRNHRVVAGLLFIGLAGLEVYGLGNNYSQRNELSYSRSLKDYPFVEVFKYIAAQRRDADIVVVGGGLYYFSSVYYNDGDAGMYLYYPNKGEAGSPRLNGYGAGTLMYETWREHTVVNMDAMPAGVRRVWWLTDNSTTADHVPYAGQWREVDSHLAGKLDLRLYQAP